jgi:hypothetical protein
MAAQSWRARSVEPPRVAFVATDGGLTGDGASADSGMMIGDSVGFIEAPIGCCPRKGLGVHVRYVLQRSSRRFLIVVGVRRAVAALEVLLDGLCNGRYFYADDDFARRSDPWIVVAA